MRKILSVLLLAFITIGLVACGDKGETEVRSDVPVTEILTTMKEEIDEGANEELLVDGELQGYVEGDLTAEDSEDPFISMFLERTQIDQDSLDEGVFLIPLMNVNSDQLIILKAKEEDNVAVLKEGLERELEEQEGIWEQYLPDQYEKVKNNIIITKGTYLAFITADDPEALEKVFNEKVK